MSLKFAVLAVLSAQPMTGYDMMQLFDDSVAFLWHAQHTQLYPELKRLEREGLLSSEDVPRGQRGTKRLYRLTEAGLEQLHQEAQTVAVPPRERDPYRLKASYFEWAGPEGARRQLEAQIEHFTKWRAVWEKLIERVRARDIPLMKVRLAGTRPKDHEPIIAFKAYAYEGLVARATMEIEWARRGLQLIDELEAAGWKGPPRSTPSASGAVRRSA